MRKFLSIIYSTLIYVIEDVSGGIKPDKEYNDTEDTHIIKTDDIEIDGVVYRITAEYKGDIEFNKTVAEWALRKAVEEMKTIA